MTGSDTSPLQRPCRAALDDLEHRWWRTQGQQPGLQDEPGLYGVSEYGQMSRILHSCLECELDRLCLGASLDEGPLEWSELLAGLHLLAIMSAVPPEVVGTSGPEHASRLHSLRLRVLSALPQLRELAERLSTRAADGLLLELVGDTAWADGAAKQALDLWDEASRRYAQIPKDAQRQLAGYPEFHSMLLQAVTVWSVLRDAERFTPLEFAEDFELRVQVKRRAVTAGP